MLLYIFTDEIGFIYDLRATAYHHRNSRRWICRPILATVHVFRFVNPFDEIQMVVAGNSVVAHVSTKGWGQLEHIVWKDFRDHNESKAVKAKAVKPVGTYVSNPPYIHRMFGVGNIVRMLDWSGEIRRWNPQTNEWPIEWAAKIADEDTHKVIPTSIISTDCGRFIINFGHREIFIFDTVQRAVCLSAIKTPVHGNVFNVIYRRCYSDADLVINYFARTYYCNQGNESDQGNEKYPECLVGLIGQFFSFEWVHLVSTNSVHWRINLAQVFAKTVVLGKDEK